MARFALGLCHHEVCLRFAVEAFRPQSQGRVIVLHGSGLIVQPRVDRSECVLRERLRVYIAGLGDKREAFSQRLQRLLLMSLFAFNHRLAVEYVRLSQLVAGLLRERQRLVEQICGAFQQHGFLVLRRV